MICTYKELCIYNAAFMCLGWVGWEMWLERRRGVSKHLGLLLLLDDTAELLSVTATAPDHVCPEQNGSLKVKPLTGAETIRLHFIALFPRCGCLALDQIYSAWGREIN